jgi:hypothetical protein
LLCKKQNAPETEIVSARAAAAFDLHVSVTTARVSHGFGVSSLQLARFGLLAIECRDDFFGGSDLVRLLAFTHGYLVSVRKVGSLLFELSKSWQCKAHANIDGILLSIQGLVAPDTGGFAARGPFI